MYLKEIVWAWNKATECGAALLCQITRLQDQLDTERDLRAALEIGLSMSAAQLSAAQTFDSKTRAEVEEIAAVEADVARLKQKVADLHLQLNQQRRQQHGASLADSTERRYRVKSLQAQQYVTNLTNPKSIFLPLYPQ
jgi:hypothetical protein